MGSPFHLLPLTNKQIPGRAVLANEYLSDDASLTGYGCLFQHKHLQSSSANRAQLDKGTWAEREVGKVPG